MGALRFLPMFVFVLALACAVEHGGPIDATSTPDAGAADTSTIEDAPIIEPLDAGNCGALCGGGPCAVLDDEAVHSAMSNNDTASIALDAAGSPAILMELEFGTQGMLARRRGPASWAYMPLTFVVGSLAQGGQRAALVRRERRRVRLVAVGRERGSGHAHRHDPDRPGGPVERTLA